MSPSWNKGERFRDLRSRLDRIERAGAARLGKRLGARHARWCDVLQRWARLVRAAVEAGLLSDEELESVGPAMRQLGDDFCGGPFGGWLTNLRLGCCRLPELKPEAMKALLLAWLSPEAEPGPVCKHCGLEYPHHKAPPLSAWKVLPGKVPLVGEPPWYDLPTFFRACPHCGASVYDVELAYQIEGGGRSWQELDGYVGSDARDLDRAARRLCYGEWRRRVNLAVQRDNPPDRADQALRPQPRL